MGHCYVHFAFVFTLTGLPSTSLASGRGWHQAYLVFWFILSIDLAYYQLNLLLVLFKILIFSVLKHITLAALVHSSGNLFQ